MRRRLGLALACALCVAAPSVAEAAPGSLGLESVAATDDARALLLNPAALGGRYPFESRFALTRDVFDADRGSGSAAFAWRGFGLFGERERLASRRYGAGFAAGTDALRLGWTASVLAPDGQGGASVGDHTLGALSRPAPWLSLGAALAHATAPEFMGTRLRREGTLGLGLRPLALSRSAAHTAGPRLTLTADLALREAEAAKHARARVGAEFEPIAGLVLRASAERGAWRAGIGLLGTRAAVSAGQQRVDDVRTAETYALSLHRGEDATRFVFPAESRVAEVVAGGVLADEALGGISLLGGAGTVPSAPLHRQFERALEDPLTRGVLLDLRGVAGMAQLEELRPRIEALRRAGKPVLAYLEYGGGRGDLYLASAADRVVASEEAFFAALGLRAERRYYKQFLAGLGVRMDRSSIGQYKSAYRNYSVDSTPAADSVVIGAALDTLQSLFVRTVAAGRRMDPAALTRYLDGRPWTSAELAEAGVLDSVGYREDARRMLGRLAGLGEKPRMMNLRRAPAARRVWTEPSPVAVVYAGGGIDAGRSGSDLLNGPYMGDQTVIAQLEKAFHAPGVRAVVLRIESPGGSALASNLIDHAVTRLKRETGKPLIVSMGSVAASGGYYIACHADRIYADRYTRTGSIGVLFVKPSFEGLYAKHHIGQEDFERGEYMRSWSYARDWSTRDQAAADSSIRRTYDAFVRKVADGRGLAPQVVAENAQGRVWFGEEAVSRRLVDEIGGLDAAIAEARRRAGVPTGERIRLLELRRPRGSFVERLLGGYLGRIVARELAAPDLMQVQAREDDALVPLSE